MAYSYESFESSEEEDEDEGYKKLKELCLEMVQEAANRELLLACDLEPERWEE
jgi:hypothetical protein